MSHAGVQEYFIIDCRTRLSRTIFETFANFLRVSVSVSENLVSEKKFWFRFRKIWYREKVSVSVSVKTVQCIVVYLVAKMKQGY